MIDALTLPLTLLVDRIVIGRSELAGLLPRDVVLLDQSPVDAAGAVAAILCMPGFPGFRTRIAGGRASLESPVDAAMDTPSPPPAASIDEVPLVIECDVGRISLTIARLRELSPGQVLDLGFDATSRVTLRLNGQPIATGELVRIAERTGVRITDVLLSRLA
ncbi:MAG: type III secretion system cytoplasmic ring protein SctQ [Acetobacteraceae bacterium]